MEINHENDEGYTSLDILNQAAAGNPSRNTQKYLKQQIAKAGGKTGNEVEYKVEMIPKTGNPVGSGQAEPIDNALSKSTTQNLPTMNAQTTPREADDVRNAKRDYSSEPESLNMNS